MATFRHHRVKLDHLLGGQKGANRLGRVFGNLLDLRRRFETDNADLIAAFSDDLAHFAALRLLQRKLPLEPTNEDLPHRIILPCDDGLNLPVG